MTLIPTLRTSSDMLLWPPVEFEEYEVTEVDNEDEEDWKIRGWMRRNEMK